jgi:hypothetical protein
VSSTVGDEPSQKFGPPPQVLASIYEMTPDVLEEIAQWLEIRGIRGMVTGSTAGTVSGGGGITGGGGTPGPPGPTGPAGPTGPTGSAGPGVPTGGTAGQELVKNSSTNYDTAWVTPTGGGAWTLLSTTTLASAGSFDVSSISGSYNDLTCVCILRSVAAGTTDSPTIYFNAETGSTLNHNTQRARANGATIDASEVRNTPTFPNCYLPAAGATASMFSTLIFTIYGYASTTWLKNVHWQSFAPFGTAASNMYWVTGAAWWNSTAAINRIRIWGGSTAINLTAGSQLRIYGCT